MIRLIIFHHRDDHCVLHIRKRVQIIFNVADLDAIAMQFDLKIILPILSCISIIRQNRIFMEYF